MSTSYVLNESHFDTTAVRALQQLPEMHAMQVLNDVASTNNLAAVREACAVIWCGVFCCSVLWCDVLSCAVLLPIIAVTLCLFCCVHCALCCPVLCCCMHPLLL